jgi:hypothetical protein
VFDSSVTVAVVLAGAALIVVGMPLTLVRIGVTVETGAPMELTETQDFSSNIRPSQYV